MRGRAASTPRRAEVTRELILTTAERLFAEHGVAAVSNRQIGEAAGQGNNTAVGYHFGGRTELVRAIARRHSAAVEEIRQRRLAGLGERADLRDWLACLIHPLAEHLAAQGNPGWYARFSEQVAADPALRPILLEESLSSPTMVRIVEGLRRSLPDLPADVAAERGEMTRELLLHMVADRERAIAEHTPTPRASWSEAAAGLIDALVGLWRAPVTTHSNERNDDEGHR